ncbi:MAG: cysteine--tRNA ligase [Bacillota bacterium]
MLKVYNTLTKEKEKFKPLNENKVLIYVCGLTVQNYSHLGHIRSAVNYDVIRRFLEYKGYEVVFVQNFTDINEKIILRAREEGLTARELAEKYTRSYLEDIDELNILRATKYVKATDNIDAIIDMINKLIENGFAYEVNGNVYFSVDKFKDYGKLSGQSLDDMRAGSRIEVVEEKKNPMDFALWKKGPEGEKEWDSPWGKGWPGWHIECSAMSTRHLGEKIDIHGGGADLIFPHHENEIAQSEASTGKKPFAKYWLHNGAVNLKGEKMSKSQGNFFTTRELLRKFTGDQIRYFLLTKHYRTPINFTTEELDYSSSSLNKIYNTFKKLRRLIDMEIEQEKQSDVDQEKIMKSFITRKRAFEEALDDDFNTARAIGTLHELIKDINIFVNDNDFILTDQTKLLVKEAYRLMEEFSSVLGLNLNSNNDSSNNIAVTNDLMNLILEIREKARENKDWVIADYIRENLNKLGFSIKDTPQGVVWEKESDN